jgi:hypothetical protein
MSALLDLPLDAIAKKVKEEKRAARGGAQSGGRGEARQGQKPQHREGGHQKSSRGGNRGSGRGGAGRARGGASGRPSPYRRVRFLSFSVIFSGYIIWQRYRMFNFSRDSMDVLSIKAG